MPLISALSLTLGIAALAVIFWVYRQGKFLGRQKGLLSKTPNAEEDRPFQRLQCVLLRLAVFVLLYLALYDFTAEAPPPAPPSPQSSIVFAWDVSRSMSDPGTREWCKDQINQYYSAWKNKAGMSGIAFAGAPQILFSAGEGPSFDFDPVAVQEGVTNLQNGLRLGGAALLPFADAKIILLTDGEESAGNALTEAYYLRHSNIKIYPLIPPKYRQPEQQQEESNELSESLYLPNGVNAGEPFKVSLQLPGELLAKTAGKKAKVKIYINGAEKYADEMTLTNERNLFAKIIQCEQSGINYIQVQLESQNMPPLAYDGFVTAFRQPQILLLERAPSRLKKMLEGRNFAVTAFAGRQFYLAKEALEKYDLVFLNDVPLDSLEKDSEFNLLDFVKARGKGLVLNLGPVSSEVDLEMSPLFDILPMEPVKDEGDDRPDISLCIVIDNSGSMSDRGLDKAAQSLIRSWENMKNVKRLCLFAYDSSPHWQTPKYPAPFNSQRILSRLEALRAGGNGILVEPALRLAYRVMQNAPLQRHVLLITDLEDSQWINDSPTLAREAFAQHKIRTHVLAIGDQGTFRADLQNLAQNGRGVYNEITKTRGELAKINWKGFESEPRRFRDKRIKVQRNRATNQNSPLLNGIPEKLPEAKGCAPLRAKNGAMAPLVVTVKDGDKEKEFSGLAHWLQGKGRVIMINAGIENENGWRNWEYVDKFWSQAARWANHPNADDVFLAQIKKKKSAYEFSFRQNDPTTTPPLPEFVEIMDVGKSMQLPLARLQEDEFICRFAPEQSGYFTVRLLDKQGYEIQSGIYYLPQIVGKASQGESVDFALNLKLLQELAEITHGEVNPGKIEIIESNAPSPEERQTNYWPYYLALAMILFWHEIMVRNDIRWKDIFRSYSMFYELVTTWTSHNQTRKSVGDVKIKAL